MNLRTSKRIAAVSLALLAAAQLAGCSSSNDNPSTTSTPPGDTGGGGGGGTGGGGGGGTGGTPVTVSGKAADGYLAGATVCLDVNASMKCDANEPTATTGTGGAFTLTIPEGVNAASHPIVVQVSETTIDEDTGVAVGKPYVLSAPAGESAFISPMTTVVHGMLQQNPALTLDDAVTQVKLSIGASAAVSLFEDYVAAKQDTSNTAADDYVRLHRIAQVAAKVMAENHETVMQAAAAQGIDTTESNAALLALVTNQVLDGLKSAAQAVDVAGDAFDLDAVTVTIADVANLTQQIQQAAAVASATKVSIESLMNQGVYWIWAEEDGEESEYEYGFLEAGAEAGRLQESWFFYDAGAAMWVAADGEDEDPSFILTADGWTQALDDVAPNFAVTYQTDGSAILDLDGSDFALKFSAAELDVSGKPIKDYLGFESHELVADSIAGEPLFSSGAKIYQINFIAMTDIYEIDVHSCPENVVSVDPSGDCNTVWGYGSNTFPHGPVTTLEALLYPAGQTPTGNWTSVGDDLQIRLLAGGGVHIVDMTLPEGQRVSFGKWEYKTVHDEQIIALTLPERFTPRFYDEGQPIFAVRDGYVRRGTFIPAGTPETFGEIQFNETAFTDIQNSSDIY